MHNMIDKYQMNPRFIFLNLSEVIYKSKWWNKKRRWCV